MADIPDIYRDLFTQKAFAHVATVGGNGQPQVTPGEVRVMVKILPERTQGVG